MDVGGEMVVKSEDAREGLRVLVRRSTLAGHPKTAETRSRPLAASLQQGTIADRPDPGDRSDAVDPHSLDPPLPCAYIPLKVMSILICSRHRLH